LPSLIGRAGCDLYADKLSHMLGQEAGKSRKKSGFIAFLAGS
jgi:hypothetical protein